MNDLERICERLKDHYNERTPIHWELYQLTEGTDTVTDQLFRVARGVAPAYISQAQLLRLFRAVRGEFRLC